MPPVGEPPHVLILGGTEEGYALAQALAARPGLRVTSSLAGATTTPRLPAGRHRIGGFGGSAGLGDWLLAEAVTTLVDASHPFALRITAQARAAAAAAGCHYLRLKRPPWRAGPGDNWHIVASLAEGLDQLTRSNAQRVLAALGPRVVPDLAGRPQRFVLRGIERPASLPANVDWLGARGPFTVADEEALLTAQAIDTLICRNSGGDPGRAKLDAARSLGLAVVLIARPEPAAPPASPDGAAPDVASGVDDALRAIDRLLARAARRDA